jgi:hypothetical protein
MDFENQQATIKLITPGDLTADFEFDIDLAGAITILQLKMWLCLQWMHLYNFTIPEIKIIHRRQLLPDSTTFYDAGFQNGDIVHCTFRIMID